MEKQPKPVGVHEGSTEVDLVMSSAKDLVFIEVKMDAAPSSGTTYDPERNQLIRNLDIGSLRASKEGKRIALVYITPDVAEPDIIRQIRAGQQPFPTDRLSWSSWGLIGNALAVSVEAGSLSAVERRFALDLLAYLAKKRLWENSLADNKRFYEDKLYEPLRAEGSAFVPYVERREERDESWRTVDWDEEERRKLLRSLRNEDKALLKLLAENDGAISQKRIMQSLPAHRGKTSASLRALKAHINGACKGHGRAPILAVGAGSGDQRVHEINPLLGDLRQAVLEEARNFSIPEDQR